MRITSILAGLGMAFAMAASAGPWELSLGLVHRSVGDFDVDSSAFVNPNLPEASPYVTGVLDYATVTGLVYTVDPTRQGSPYDTVALHRIDFAGDSEGMDSALGVLIAARTELGERWGTPWFLNLSVLWFGTDASTAGTVAGTTEFFSALDYSWSGNTVVVDGAAPPTDLASVYGTYAINLDLDAFTFGLGLGTDLALPVGALRVEVGPTLTVVDYNEDATSSAYWENDDVLFSGARTSDDGVDFLAGFYGDLSFAYDFNERVGLGLGVRYDYLFQKLETDLGEVDLSGFSAMLKVLVRF